MFTLTDGGGRVDSFEHALHREVDVVHRREDVVVQRVEADGHALQPRLAQRGGLLGEQRPVRRQRQVEPVDRRELLDESLDVPADERLTPGDPDLLDAVVREGAREPRDLLEREKLASVEEAVVAPEDLLRHAVDAAEVAAVGDRDA
jgi:hypothetical protein